MEVINEHERDKCHESEEQYLLSEKGKYIECDDIGSRVRD